MRSLIRIGLFFIGLLVAPPVFSAIVAAPDLSVVQREKEIQVIFSWEKPVDFTEETVAERYRLSFPVQISETSVSLSQIRAALPLKWRRMRLIKEKERLDLSIVLPEGGFVEARKEENRIFVSLRDGKPSVKNDSEKKSEEKKAAELKTEQSAAEFSKPPENVAEEKPVSAGSIPVKKNKTAERSESATAVPAAEVPMREVIDDSEDAADRKTAAEMDMSIIPYSASQTDVSLMLSNPKVFGHRPTEYDNLSKEDLAGYRAASLSFPWSRMTGAAAFRREGYLWIVFDRQGDFDFSLEKDVYKDIIYEMVQIPHSQATIYRLVTAKGYNPSLRREGLLWIVDLMYQPMIPRQPLDLILQRKTVFGPRIFIPLNESPVVLPMVDPEVGDLMYIIPVFALGKGVPHARSFVDASFLQTAQGIVIVPNIEELNVYSSTSGIEVRGPEGGMRFSSEDILTLLAKMKINTDPLSQILDVASWGGNDGKTYIGTLKELQANVAEADEKNKDIQRLILARYYFANGMYPETLSVLQTIMADNKTMAELPGVIALRGAANFMMMRYDEAIKDLSSPLLKDDDASKYFRAATLAASSTTPDIYLSAMKESMDILQAYPQPIKTRLALAGLHAAVAANDEFSIQNFMEAANNSGNSAAENDEIAFYHALWQELTGQYSLARDEIKRLTEGKNLYFRAMAGLEKVRMDSRSKAITPQERVAELERLSYAWRGGEFEYNLMTLLVAAYQDQKDFAQVLHILNDMKYRFKDSSESEKIQKLMEEIFQKLYLGDGENLLPPVKAIALYDEFKELTPPGEKGAQVVRRLADRLVSIDLLERAASLLETQLKQKISNKERGLISTRVALIRLLNKEPEKALDALKISEDKVFSDKLQKQRMLIKAKALADLKKTDEAADLLEKNESEAAKMLRAEIFWQAQRWDKAADALKVLIKKPDPKKKLTPQEAQRILDWAAALRLAGRPKVVMRVRENFMPFMKETELAQAFDFITKSPQQGLMDYHLVAQEVESAESFHTFAKEYTNLIKTQGLSETVR